MASGSSFDRLKHIDEQTRDLVFGYLRRIEMQFNIDHSAPLIKHLCLLFYCTFFESTILTKEENRRLEELLSTNESFSKTHSLSKWKLLLQGTKDGFSSKTFNETLKQKKNVLSIIHTSDDNIFGGFLSKGFDGGKHAQWNYYNYVDDPNAFLFLIRSNKDYEPQIFPVKKDDTAHAAHLTTGYFCCFGNHGYNIALGDGCDIRKDSWVDWHNCWKQGAYNTPSPYYLNGGKSEFLVKDYEIFTAVDEDYGPPKSPNQ